jgi:Phospholipase_D-nuclease N-terminal
MANQKHWNELSKGQQAAVVAGAAVELVLTAVALVDLSRRPAEQVRGPKALWAAGCFVQPVGPVLYLAVGRRPA